MKYKKILKVIFVDFFSLVVGILNGFFLPKIFSIDEYAFYKIFTLYISYAGVFHLGFSDGIYILYGGKKEEEIDKRKLRGYYNSLLKIDLIVFAIFLIISLFLMHYELVLIYFTFYILPFQIVHFFRLFYRAIGEFNKYSLLQGSLTFLNLVNVILNVLIFKSSNVLIIIQIINLFILAIFFSYKFCINYNERIV